MIKTLIKISLGERRVNLASIAQCPLLREARAGAKAGTEEGPWRKAAYWLASRPTYLEMVLPTVS